MPSPASARTVPTPALILAGITVFCAGFLVSLSRSPSPGVHAQDDCAQPSASGCPMNLGSTVQAAINDPSSIHNWLLNVPDNSNFSLDLTNLPGDYEISVYGPDNSIVGADLNTGLQDKIAHVNNIGAGTYWIVVDSPRGDASANPYTLVATALPTVPFSSYGTTPRFAPY